MTIKRVSVSTNSLEFVGNLYTYKVVKKLLTISKKLKINISNASIEALKEKYLSLEEVPEDRVNLKSWLSNVQTEYSKEEFASEEKLNRICSEILNACEQENLEKSSLIFISDDENEEEIEVKIFTKTQPLEQTSSNDDAEWWSFTDSNLKLMELNPFFRRLIPESSLLDKMVEEEILSNILVFQNLEKLNAFVMKAKETIVSLNDEIAYKLNSSNHSIDFSKAVSNNEDIWKLLNENINKVKNWDINTRKGIVETIFASNVPILFGRNSNISKESLEKILNETGLQLEFKNIYGNTEINIKFENNIFSFDKEVCPNCGEISLKSFIDPFGRKKCQGCIRTNQRVLSYHSNTISNPMKSCGSKPSEKTRYGFELEMIRSTSFDTDRWYEKIAPIIYSESGNLAKLEYDGSLGSEGEEMISQPLNKEFILGPKMKELLDSCKELYHSESCCGLHFHIDKSALTPKGWGKLLRFVANNYRKFIAAGIFRNPNSYCQINTICNIVNRESDDAKIFEKFCNETDHYSYISRSGHTNRTVEFRCFASTVDYEQFMKNVKTIMILLDNAELLSEQTDIQII